MAGRSTCQRCGGRASAASTRARALTLFLARQHVNRAAADEDDGLGQLIAHEPRLQRLGLGVDLLLVVGTGVDDQRVSTLVDALLASRVLEAERGSTKQSQTRQQRRCLIKSKCGVQEIQAAANMRGCWFHASCRRINSGRARAAAAYTPRLVQLGQALPEDLSVDLNLVTHVSCFASGRCV